MFSKSQVGQKIDNFINSVEKSRYAFSKKTGIRDNTMGRIVEVGDLKLSQIYQIVDAYPNFWSALEPHGIDDLTDKTNEERLTTVKEVESEVTYKKQSELDLIDIDKLQSKIEALEEQLSEKDKTIAELTKSVLNLTQLINNDNIPTRVMDNSDKRLMAEENRKKIEKAENDKMI